MHRQNYGGRVGESLIRCMHCIRLKAEKRCRGGLCQRLVKQGKSCDGLCERQGDKNAI